MKQFWIVLTLLVTAAAIGAKIPLDAKEAHRQADAVLWPRFIAVSNEWVLSHGAIQDAGHLDKIDAKDKKRFDAACEAFNEWHQAMKQAGY